MLTRARVPHPVGILEWTLKHMAVCASEVKTRNDHMAKLKGKERRREGRKGKENIRRNKGTWSCGDILCSSLHLEGFDERL